MSEAAHNGFEIPGWPGGDYVGPKSETILAGADIFVGGLCFIRREGLVLLATASATQTLRHRWVRVRHSAWAVNQRRWCRLVGNTLVVYGPQGARQEFAMLQKTAVLVRPNGDIMALDLCTLHLSDTMVVEHRCRVTVDDICPPLVLPTLASQGTPKTPYAFGGTDIAPPTTGGVGWGNTGPRPPGGRWG